MKLKEYLQANGIKQNFFAKQIGISTQFLNGLIKGRNIPSLEVAIRIEEATKGKVKPKDLVLPKEENTSPPRKRNTKQSADSSAEDPT